MYYVLARHIRDSIVDCVANTETVEVAYLWIEEAREDDKGDWEYKVVGWDFDKDN